MILTFFQKSPNINLLLINHDEDTDEDIGMTQAEIDLARNVAKSLEGTTQKERDHLRNYQLSPKTDLVLWTKLEGLQLDLYQKLLYSEEIREIISNDNEFGLGAVHWLTRLKQICDHPALLSVKACQFLGIPHYSKIMEKSQDHDWFVNQSGKMKLVTQLFEANKDRKTLSNSFATF